MNRLNTAHRQQIAGKNPMKSHESDSAARVDETNRSHFGDRAVAAHGNAARGGSMPPSAALPVRGEVGSGHTARDQAVRKARVGFGVRPRACRNRRASVTREPHIN